MNRLLLKATVVSAGVSLFSPSWARDPDTATCTVRKQIFVLDEKKPWAIRAKWTVLVSNEGDREIRPQRGGNHSFFVAPGTVVPQGVAPGVNTTEARLGNRRSRTSIVIGPGKTSLVTVTGTIAADFVFSGMLNANYTVAHISFERQDGRQDALPLKCELRNFPGFVGANLKEWICTSKGPVPNCLGKPAPGAKPSPTRVD